MKKYFIVSLVKNGILGGGLYLDPDAVTYKTNKLTVDKKYRNLVLPMNDILSIEWKWVIFPIATIYMKEKTNYKFLIFNKRRFQKWFNVFHSEVK